ncbi:MAG: hypothetical protein ACOX7H_06040 [Bacillota bacterium]|jgi:Flp pilus assembly protein TadG
MNRKFRMPLGLGGPSIIMVFLVLCLATLGSLSLVTANSDWKLTQKAAAAVSDYYAADNKAEEILASTDASLKAGRSIASNTYLIRVSDNSDLVLIIKTDGTGYKVLSHKLVTKSQWDYNQYDPVFNSTLVE